MTAFFIPGISSDADGVALERAYLDLCARVELEMGRRPRARRIEKLWARRGNMDALTVVGRPDPLRGGTVMAIFEMGSHQPFVVWRKADFSPEVGCCEVLGCSAYSVMDFDP